MKKLGTRREVFKMKYSSQKIKKLYKVKKRRRILRSRLFWFFVLILVASLSFTYLFCFSSVFQVKEIEISGNQKVPAENIKRLVEINFPKKFLLFKSKSLFLANLGEIESNLLNEFAGVGKVDFDKDFPGKLLVSVEERKPIAVFRRDERYFFIDDQGIAFEEVLERDSWLTIDCLDRDWDLKLGERVVEERELSPVLEIRSKLQELGIRIRSAEVVSYYRVDIETLEGWKIYFNLEDDVFKQVFNLELILKEKISPEERGNLEYIDLRFGNQVYYK